LRPEPGRPVVKKKMNPPLVSREFQVKQQMVVYLLSSALKASPRKQNTAFSLILEFYSYGKEHVFLSIPNNGSGFSFIFSLA
ncbi:hypothetical protein L9F63_022311, partial [Diploptera punctata]